MILMKLFLTKVSHDKQLGHLYEHIFLNVLSDLLRLRGYLSYLDYHLEGEVFASGVVVVKIETYSPILNSEIGDLVQDLKIDFTADVIAGAALQILAEKMAGSDGFDENINQELRKIHDQPWQDLNQVEVLKNQILSYDNYLGLFDASESDFFKTKLEFRIKVDDGSNLAPLAVFISKILISSATEIIENDFWSYLEKVDTKLGQGEVIASAIFWTSKKQPLEIDERVGAVKSMLGQMSSDEVVNRIKYSLGNVQYSNGGVPAVGVVELGRLAGVIVGSLGWKNLATVDNIRFMLSGIEVQLSCNNTELN